MTSKDKFIKEMPDSILLWSEDGVVTSSELKRWAPVARFKGENPRWSPDGSQFVFTKDSDVWLVPISMTNPEKIIHDVVTETGTGAYWTETGDGIVAISSKNDRQVIRWDLQSKETQIIHDEGKTPFKGYRLTQGADLRHGGRYLLTFTRDSGHRSMIIDLEEKRYITNEFMLDGDCEPSWSLDGRFLVMTRRVRINMNRPLFVAEFNESSGELSDSEYLIGTKRCYNASISNDSKHVVFVSSGDVYMWRIDWRVDSRQDGVQLTNSGRSSGPNLHVR